MLMMNGLVGDFTFAARLKGEAGAALDAVLSAAESERDLLGVVDVEGRRDLPDRQVAVSDRTDAADHRPGRSRRPVARHRPEANRNAASGDSLSSPARIDVRPVVVSQPA